MENDQIIPIEKRIKNMETICSGLYPHEVLAFYYAKIYTTGENHYSGFWDYKYGIKDMDSVLRSLCKKGYIEAGPLELAMKKYTIPELKKLLKQHSLKVTGKKDELIQRLINNISDIELNSVFVDKPYILTPLGNDILKKEAYILYIHCRNIANLDIWNLSEIIHKMPPMHYKSAIIKYLSNQCKNFVSKKLYTSYISYKVQMADIALEENIPQLALKFLLESIYYILNGISDNFDNTQLQESLKYFIPYKYEINKFILKDMERFKQCKNLLKLSDVQLKETAIKTFLNIKLPFNFFTADECADIIVYDINNKKEIINNICRIAEKRFKAAHKNEYDKLVYDYNLYKSNYEKIKQEVIESNKIYDEEWEKEVAERLSKLDDFYKKEFYRLRASYNDDLLSHKELDKLNLESMEKSYNYSNEK